MIGHSSRPPSSPRIRPRAAGARVATLAAALAVCVLACAACVGAGARASTLAATPVYTFGVFGQHGQRAALEKRRPTRVRGIRGRVVQIATSNSDGYALTAGGTVWAWGLGGYGELGNGRRTRYSARAVRVQFPEGIRIAKLANPMPVDGALAIGSRGHVWGWGLDAEGDLCRSAAMELRPTRLPLRDVTLATGAYMHSLFDSRGKIYGCGSGVDGVLGNGHRASRSKPSRVRGLPAHARVIALTSSFEGSGALLADGSYYDWGYNGSGQLGDGSTANSSLPVHVKLPAAVHQVFQGGSGWSNGQTIAILADGSVWTWGSGRQGQLGIGTRTSSDAPVPVTTPPGVRFVKINSGGFASYAIDGAGRLWAWGANRNGQLGTGSGARAQADPIDVGIHLTQVSSTGVNVAGLGGH